MTTVVLLIIWSACGFAVGWYGSRILRHEAAIRHHRRMIDLHHDHMWTPTAEAASWHIADDELDRARMRDGLRAVFGRGRT